MKSLPSSVGQRPRLMRPPPLHDATPHKRFVPSVIDAWMRGGK
jgi:hypothetical protein